jgi:hypothetical protein
MGMSRSKGVSKTLLAVIVVAIIAAAGGAAALLLLQQPGEEKVFYVIAYHWNFAFFDEDLKPVDRIVVNKGDQVKIYVFPADAFAPDFRAQLEKRALQEGIGDLEPGDPRIEDELKSAREQGLLDHGFMIQGYGVSMTTSYKSFSQKANSLEELLKTESQDALEAHALTVKADKAGSFYIICTVVCSFGHPWMVVEGGFVVQG